MEWVETTGRSIEEAKERALDELGVDESDAEFDVIEDARSGLFGRLRSEARVRARVRPTAPRSKEDRRDRRRRSKSAGDRTTPSTVTDGNPAGARSTGSDAAERTPAGPPGTSGTTGATTADAADSGEVAGVTTAESRGGRRRPDRNRPSARRADAGAATNGNQRGEGNDVEVALDEQGRIAQDFLTKLTAEFGLQAEVSVERPDEDTVDLHLRGGDLGLLIGQKGATLLAIQDLTRTVVHHQTGAGNGRIHVDVGGYRQKRSEALARFAEQVAATVKQSGNRSVLEPMSAADRKVVHDAITGIEGVSTISEGEDPRRRVVVIPDQP